MTKLFYGTEEATKSVLDFTSNADTAIDACLDSTGPSVMMGVDVIKNERLKAKKRGVNFRYITEITKDNLSYCRELSEFAEVRHLNGVKGNFEVSKNGIKGGKAEYIGTATLQEAEPVAQLIYSNVKEIVEQQQFVFDTLWNKAIPFQVRVKEIEESLIPESIEIIPYPKEALEAEYRILKSAKQEVQMIFSTVNTFLLQERQLGITQMLSNLSKTGVKVRILTPIDDNVRELISNLKNQQGQQENEGEKYHHQQQQQQQEQEEEEQRQLSYQKNNANANNTNSTTTANINTNASSVIDIQDIAPSSSINTKIIVVDKQNSLVMEIKDSLSDSLDNAIGLSTLSNSKSTVASYYAIFENLSKQNQLYEQLKDTYQKVENANAIQQEFINVAAHELRTPIQSILGYTELLLEDETEDRKKHSLFAILYNSERLQKLASDILDIARIESSTFRLNKRSLNLDSTISNIIKDYVKRQKQRDAMEIAELTSNINGGNNNKDNKNKKNKEAIATKLVFRPKVKEGEEDIVVQADEERLTQVIDNILDNAFKFTDSDGSITVTLEKKQEGQGQHQAIITIKDTGKGIDPEILPRLFTKFTTKSHKGTGLGLYISKNTVEAHGGKLYAENNTDGKGATFTIILPIFNK
jgi:two-component system, OmpR family, sensor histidine kinase VicK